MNLGAYRRSTWKRVSSAGAATLMIAAALPMPVVLASTPTPKPVKSPTIAQISNTQLIANYFKLKYNQSGRYPTISVCPILNSEYTVTIHITATSDADRSKIKLEGESIRALANKSLYKIDRSQPDAIPSNCLIWDITAAQQPQPPPSPQAPAQGPVTAAPPPGASISFTTPPQDAQSISAQQIANLFTSALSQYKATVTAVPVFGNQFVVSITAAVSSFTDQQNLLALATATVAAVNKIQPNAISATGLNTSGVTLTATDPHQITATAITNQLTTMLADSRITVKVEPRPNNSYQVYLSGILESCDEVQRKVGYADTDIADIQKTINSAQQSQKPTPASVIIMPPTPFQYRDLTFDPTARLITLFTNVIGNPAISVVPQPLAADPKSKELNSYVIVVSGEVANREAVNAIRRVALSAQQKIADQTKLTLKLDFTTLVVADAPVRDVWHIFSLGTQIPADTHASASLVQGVVYAINSLFGAPQPTGPSAPGSPLQPGTVATVLAPPTFTPAAGSAAGGAGGGSATPSPVTINVSPSAITAPAPAGSPPGLPAAAPSAPAPGAVQTPTSPAGTPAAAAATTPTVPLAFSDGNNIWLSGFRSQVEAAKAFLALVDSPLPQVQMDTWEIQVSGNSHEVEDKVDYIDDQIVFAKNRMEVVQDLIRELVRKKHASLTSDREISNKVLHYFLNPQDALPDKDRYDKSLEFAFSANESLVLLGISKRPDLMATQLISYLQNNETETITALKTQVGALQTKIQNLPGEGRNGWAYSDVQPRPDEEEWPTDSEQRRLHRIARAGEENIRARLERELKQKQNEIEMLLEEQNAEQFANLTTVWHKSDATSDRNAIKLFLKRLDDYRSYVRALGIYDQTAAGITVPGDNGFDGLSPSEELDRLQFAPEMLTRSSIAVNTMLEHLMFAFSSDMKQMFCEPALKRIRSHFATSTGANVAGKVSLLVTSQQQATVTGQVIGNVDATRPAPITNDLLSALFPSSSSTPGGASGLLAKFSPQYDAALVGAAVLNNIAPVYAQVAPGVNITAMPTITPDGGSADLFVSAAFGVATNEPNPAAGGDYWVTQPPDAVSQHTVTTRATVDGFKLVEISSLDIAETHPHPPFYIPILGRLPLVGPAFQVPAPPHTVQHRSIIMTNVTIVPRVLGLVGFYGGAKAGFMQPWRSNVKQHAVKDPTPPLTSTVKPTQ